MHDAFSIKMVNLFSPLGEITLRSMFGGFGLFADGVIFSLIKNEHLHIRSHESTRHEFKKRGYKVYSYEKRGLPVMTRYYAVPKDVVNDSKQVIQLASEALYYSKKEVPSKYLAVPVRIKDLPNLRISTERMLKKSGIDSVEYLRELGALEAFLTLRDSHHLPIAVELLWFLEGAINGIHWSVVSQKRREELKKQLEQQGEQSYKS